MVLVWCSNVMLQSHDGCRAQSLICAHVCMHAAIRQVGSVQLVHRTLKRSKVAVHSKTFVRQLDVHSNCRRGQRLLTSIRP